MRTFVLYLKRKEIPLSRYAIRILMEKKNNWLSTLVKNFFKGARAHIHTKPCDYLIKESLLVTLFIQWVGRTNKRYF